MPVQHDKIKVTIGQIRKKEKKFIDKFFILIHIIFGYDYGFFTYQSRNMKILTRIYTVVYGFIINLIHLIYILIKMNPLRGFGYILNLIHHLAHILILLHFDKDTFCIFLKDLEIIDLLLNINRNSYGVGLKIAVSIMFTLAYNIILTILYCAKSHKYCLNPMIMQILCFIPIMACYIPLIVTFFMYREVHFRLKKITSCIENLSQNILGYQNVYKALVDTTEKIKKSFDVMVRMSFFFHLSAYGEVSTRVRRSFPE